MGKAIVVIGTPGVGKTTLSRLLAKHYQARHIDLSSMVREKELILGVDEERDSLIVDEDRVMKAVERIVAEHHGLVIVEGHFADITPRHLVKAALVLRLHPLELEKRLLSLGWSRRKVLENVASEILDHCLIAAVEAYGENLVREVDATGKSPEELLKIAVEAIEKGGSNFRPGQVNWLAELAQKKLLNRFFSENPPI